MKPVLLPACNEGGRSSARRLVFRRGANRCRGGRENNFPGRHGDWLGAMKGAIGKYASYVTDEQTGHTQAFPAMCQHCEFPPCVDVCTTGASFRRADGIVLVNKHTCIGCRYCMMACPYKARSLVHEPTHNQKTYAPRGIGTVESCTLCVHKVDRGDGITACAEACLRAGHQAILFGDLKDPDSEISKRLAAQPSKQIRADLNLNTGVRYQGLLG